MNHKRCILYLQAFKVLFVFVCVCVCVCVVREKETERHIRERQILRHTHSKEDGKKIREKGREVICNIYNLGKQKDSPRIKRVRFTSLLAKSKYIYLYLHI